jgi:hypothetical protein
VILSRQPLLVIMLIIITLSILQEVNNQFHVQKKAPKKNRVSPKRKEKVGQAAVCEGVFNIISEANLMLTHVRDTRTSCNSLTEKVIKFYLDYVQYV